MTAYRVAHMTVFDVQYRPIRSVYFWM